MNEQELNSRVEAYDFTDELSDEALDRAVVGYEGSVCCCGVGGPGSSMIGN
jgi:hypothetical protein